MRWHSHIMRKKKCSVVCIAFVLLMLLLTTLNIILFGLGWNNNSNNKSHFGLWAAELLLDPPQQLGDFRIHLEWHPQSRSERFPSVDERVKLYMSNWYHPTCKGSAGSFVGKYVTTFSRSNSTWPSIDISDPPSKKLITIDSMIMYHHTFLLHRSTIEDCARTREQYSTQGKLASHDRIRFRWAMQTYCSEAVELMDIMDQLDRSAQLDSKVIDTTNSSSTPLLAYFGDQDALCHSDDCIEIPLIAKFRAGTTKAHIEAVAGGLSDNKTCLKVGRSPLKTSYYQTAYNNKFSPILWRLNTVRHWNTLPGALRKDTSWEEKNNSAFFGGDMTGNYTGSSDLERCLSNQRCRFVLDHANSSLIDARVTDHLNRLTNNTVNGIQVVRKKVGVDIIQKHKIIISLEGNDVASGLKWSLQSESVVLMPPPTRTTWAMEELLQPWVHYIPMHPDGSNAEEMVRWALNNEKKARRIAERATLFIYDLVYHPDAADDDRKVKERIAQRYRALWH